MSRKSACRKTVISILCLLGFCCFSKAAETVANNEPIMMSPFEVEAQGVDFEGWKKLRSPNFVVYTDASAKRVRPLLQQMEMMHMVTQVIMGRKPLSHQPVHVILPTQESDWKKLGSRGKFKWRSGVSGESDFTYLCLLQYDWQEKGIYLMWTMLSSIESSILGIDWSFPLSRGVRYYFETIQPTEEGIRVGAGNPRMLAVKDSKWLKWERFFQISTRSPEYRNDGSAKRKFAGQAAAFVHYLLSNPDAESLPKLLDWNARLQAGRKPTSEEFEQVFGMTYQELNEVMKKYVGDDKFRIQNFGIPQELQDFVVTELEVTSREMRELFILIQIKNQRTDESKQALEALLQRGVQTPHLRALLVSACVDWKRHADALATMERMIESGDDARESFAGAAMLTLYQEVGLPSLDGRISVEGEKQIKRYAEGGFAREINDSATNLTWAWTHALVEDIEPSDLDEIRITCRRMEGNGDTSNPLAALAVAAWRIGDEKLSRRLVDLLLDSPYCDKHVRPLLEELSQRLG